MNELKRKYKKVKTILERAKRELLATGCESCFLVALIQHADEEDGLDHFETAWHGSVEKRMAVLDLAETDVDAFADYDDSGDVPPFSMEAFTQKLLAIKAEVQDGPPPEAHQESFNSTDLARIKRIPKC